MEIPISALLSPPQDAQQFNLNDVKAVRLETGKLNVTS